MSIIGMNNGSNRQLTSQRKVMVSNNLKKAKRAYHTAFKYGVYPGPDDESYSSDLSEYSGKKPFQIINKIFMLIDEL